MKLSYKFRRVGITGSARSGKTVFLMSLISHLEKGKLTLALNEKQVTTRKFRRVPCNPGWLDAEVIESAGLRKFFRGEKNEFDYDGLISHLARAKEWPEKTIDNFFYRCRFERSDVKLTGTEIEFFDFPGERVADVTMIGKDYAEWSERMLQTIANEPAKKQHAADFLESTRRDVLVEADLIERYKDALARLILDFHPLISPSTFLVDTDGIEATGSTPEEIIAGTARAVAKPRFSGLRDAEFVPLPLTQKQKQPELFKKFADRYQRYQREVVNPFTRNLLACHNLVFLIDISDILGSGDQKYNDIHLLIKELLNYIDQGMGFFRRLCRGSKNLVSKLYGLKSGWIESIAFVASKADKVHPVDRDKLVPLLRDLAQPLVDNSELAGKAEFLPCISVLSTEAPNEDDQLLVGRPIWMPDSDGYRKLPPDGERVQVRVSPLPIHWPDAWDGSAFSFYDFYPIIPAVRGNPPKQKGLERIMEFILNH